MRRHVFAWKEREFQEIKKLAVAYPVIAIARPEMFPASLFQQLRKKLKGRAVIRVTKTKVAKRALEESGVSSEQFLRQMTGQVALVFTALNPFELHDFLKKNKGAIAAKAGMIAPEDIIVRAGDTGLPPGPALSDLKAAGLSVRVQGATIAVTEDRIVAKKGEQINAAIASTLAKLEIKPIRVGLNINSCHENGEVFDSSVLNIEAEQVFNDFAVAHSNAFNLAFNVVYFTKENIPLLVARAFKNAKALAVEASIITQSTVRQIMAKATRQAIALNDLLKENIVEKSENN